MNVTVEVSVMHMEKPTPRIFLTMTALLVLILAMGCGSGNPVAPRTEPAFNMQDENAHPGQSLGNRSLWGLWQFKVDLSNEEVEIVPLRLGEAHVNVIRLLEPAAFVYLRIDDDSIEIDLAKGTIDVDIILEHPLAKSPEYTGFDVRGIFITDGSLGGLSIDEELVMSASEESRILNPDGYTRWWNPTEFTGSGLLGYVEGKLGKPHGVIGYSSTLNGYKYFADGLSAEGEILDPLILVNRGRFSSESENRRHYKLMFGPDVDDIMVFNYAVDTSWERPDKFPPTTIDDFSLSANSLEPFHIRINEEVNSLYWDPEIVDCPQSGGIIRVSVEVATWQGVGGISEVYVGSPEIGADFIQATETGGYDEYYAYISTYTAELVATDVVTYEPQIIVAAYSGYGSYETGPEGLGIPFDGPLDARLAEFNVITVEVIANSPPMIGRVIGPAGVLAGEAHTYQVDSWFDCQDMKEDLSFSWETGDDNPAEYNDGIGNVSGAFIGGDGSIDIIFINSGTFRVDARLTDRDGTHGYSEQPLEVDVGIPPIPVFPDDLNLKLDLKRSFLYSYEYSNNPSDIPEITLSWDGSAVSNMIAEWVIYRDENPYDEIEEWQEIGTSHEYEFSNLLTGEFGYNSGKSYYFKVTARSIMGNPDSESEGSTQWAFIEFENGEPDGASEDQHPWVMGYGGYESAYHRQWERPGEGGAVAGSCWMMDPDSAYMRRHQWSVIASPELPILTDPVLAQTTEKWYMEMIFGGQVTPMNENWDNYARLSVGTVPDDPGDHTGDQTYYDYIEAPPGAHMSGTPYYTLSYWSSNNSRFDLTSGDFRDRHGWGKTEYGWPFNFTRFRLTDLDPNGTGRVRAAIGFGSGSTTDTRARPRADEIAVIIY